MEVFLCILILLFLLLYLDTKSAYKRLQKKHSELEQKIKQQNVSAIMTDAVQEKNDIVKPVENGSAQSERITINSAVNSAMPDEKKEQVKRSEESNKINWMFGIGITLFCLLFFVIINSTWKIISSEVKCIIVLAFSLVFFGASILIEKVTKAKKPTLVLWSLGLIYVPFSLIALFGFGMFGPFWSFSGDGANLCMVVIALISLILSILSVIRFKNMVFVWTYVASEMLTILFATRVFTTDYSVTLLILTIYSLMTLLVCEVIKKMNNIEYIYSQYNLYTKIINFALNALIIIKIATDILYGNLMITTVLAAGILIFNNCIAIRKLNSKLLMTILPFNAMVFSLGIAGVCINGATTYTYLIAYNIFCFISIAVRLILIDKKKYKELFTSMDIILYFNILLTIFSQQFLTDIRQIFIITVLSIGSYIVTVYLEKEEKGKLLIPFLFILFGRSLSNLIYAGMTINNSTPIISLLLVILYIAVRIFKCKKEIGGTTLTMMAEIPFIILLIRIWDNSSSLENVTKEIIYSIVPLGMFVDLYMKTIKKEIKDVLGYIISFLTYYCLLRIGYTVNVITVEFVYTLSATLMIIIGLFITKNENFKIPFELATSISLVVGLFVSLVHFEKYMIWYYAVVFIYAIYKSIAHKENEKLTNTYLCCGLIVGNFVMYSALSYCGIWFNINQMCNYTLILTGLGTCLFLPSIRKNNYNEKMITIYLAIVNVLSFMALQNTSFGEGLIGKLVPSITSILLLMIQLPYVSKKLQAWYKVIALIILLNPYFIILNHFNFVSPALNLIVYTALIFIILDKILKEYMSEYTSDDWKMIFIILAYIVTVFTPCATIANAIWLDIVMAILVILMYKKQNNRIFITTSVAFIIIVIFQMLQKDFPIAWLICLLLFAVSFTAIATISEIKKKK